jgi:hypothetical protein
LSIGKDLTPNTSQTCPSGLDSSHQPLADGATTGRTFTDVFPTQRDPLVTLAGMVAEDATVAVDIPGVLLIATVSYALGRMLELTCGAGVDFHTLALYSHHIPFGAQFLGVEYDDRNLTGSDQGGEGLIYRYWLG